MGYLAFGIFLLLVGMALIVSGIPYLLGAGWTSVALASILIVVHLAVGPRRGGTRTP